MTLTAESSQGLAYDLGPACALSCRACGHRTAPAAEFAHLNSQQERAELDGGGGGGRAHVLELPSDPWWYDGSSEVRLASPPPAGGQEGGETKGSERQTP